MLKENEFKTFTVTCDECGDEEDTHADHFAAAVIRVKELGWKTEIGGSINGREDSKWYDYCPTCS